MSATESSKVLPGSTSPDKKQDKASIIDLKNGKVVCKQKAISFEKQSETLQEIVKFRETLEERIDSQQSPLTQVPEEYKPVIVKLAHESDKGLLALAKHIRQELLPVQDEDDEDKLTRANAMLPQTAVESAINSLLDRNNYGLDAPNGTKLPASLAVWRWEVKDEYKDWLPKSGREKAEVRLEERKQAKQVLISTFQRLDKSEQDALFNIKGSNTPTKAKDSTRTPAPTSEASEKKDVAVGSAKKKGKKKTTEAENDNTERAKPSKPKKVVDPEKAAKEKEKLEKKAAKAEREQKAKDAHNKSRSIMANFFSKAKPVVSSASSPAKSATASSSQSEFERVFKPFILKKDSVLASQNWFKDSRKQRRHSRSIPDSAEIIVIDDDEDGSEDIEMLDSTIQANLSEDQLSKMSSKERLNNILSSLPSPADSRRLPRQRPLYSYQVYHPTSIRDIVSQLSEAEVAGDDGLVRNLLAKLGDRKQFPAKAFIFHEDARPGYFGTWTRNSKVIGPRRPFTKDLVVFDYGYDSGEEWEEEPVGDDVADDEEEEETEEPDSDADSWLVDDDEEVEVDLKDLDSLDAPDIFDLPVPPVPVKRKADDGEKKLAKKRKVVVPLVPFAKGPCWEESIGECSYGPFQQYRIQLFNDTPFPIDPFTFVSTCVEDYREYRANQTKTAAPVNGTSASNNRFVVPLLPVRLNGTNTPTSSDNPSDNTQPQPKKALKTPFPDVHLPVLLNKIIQTDTGSFNSLVELIYEELKPHKVTKAAIEAKIREVGEKVNKKWTVKPFYLNPISSTAVGAQIPT